MNHSGTEQLLSRNKTILPRFLQEICDLYHLGELAVQVISAENRYVSWKSSVWATREPETTWHGGREMPNLTVELFKTHERYHPELRQKLDPDRSNQGGKRGRIV